LHRRVPLHFSLTSVKQQTGPGGNGTLIGALILGFLNNGLNLLGVSSSQSGEGKKECEEKRFQGHG
jgi:hypothetical protein